MHTRVLSGEVTLHMRTVLLVRHVEPPDSLRPRQRDSDEAKFSGLRAR